jgi:hypothetical protein
VHSLLTATAVDEHSEQVGRPFFLDTGGFDGRQARTRRQINAQIYRKRQRSAGPQEKAEQHTTAGDGQKEERPKRTRGRVILERVISKLGA